MLGRGGVARAGLIAGAGWAVVTTPLLPPAQAVPNLAIAPILATLAVCVDDRCATDRPAVLESSPDNCSDLVERTSV
jgi:hypothetical protein